MSDLPTLIASVLAHDAKATPGPWMPSGPNAVVVRGPRRVFVADTLTNPSDLCDNKTTQRALENCLAIAHYRTAAPRLARECERLQALALDRWEEAEELRILLGNASQESLEGLVQRAHRDRDTARDVLTRIAATMACEPDDDADLIEAVRLLVVERDRGKAARAEVERLALREPTVEEMERVLAGRDEVPAGDPYPAGWPTIRRCRHCARPVAGGPTACVPCAIADARDTARAEVERLRAALVGVRHGIDKLTPCIGDHAVAVAAYAIRDIVHAALAEVPR